MNTAIIKENLPCWYQMSWREKDPAIVLKLHEDFIAGQPTFNKNAPIIGLLKEKFGFKKFAGNLEKNFGFNDAFIRNGKHGNFVEFIAKIPEIRTITGKDCCRCKGEGVLNGKECLFCCGTGKKHEYDYRSAYAFLSTFCVFFILVESPVRKTSAGFFQLMVINNTAEIKMADESLLCGKYGICLCEWLEKFGKNERIDEVIEAMETAYCHMISLKELGSLHFDAYINKGLHIVCPGKKCELSPLLKSGEKGVRFSGQNIRTPAQHISLLVGLAALCDAVRKKIK